MNSCVVCMWEVLGDGCSLHDSNTLSALLHVVPTAVQPLTPTTLPPSSLARTTVFGYKLNRGYHKTVNTTTALLFHSNLYCHVTVLTVWLSTEVKLCTAALWQPDCLTAAHSGFGWVLILFYNHYYATIWNNSQVTEIVFSLLLFQYSCTRSVQLLLFIIITNKCTIILQQYICITTVCL